MSNIILLRWFFALFLIIALGVILAYFILRAPVTPEHNTGPDSARPAVPEQRPQTDEQTEHAVTKVLDGDAAWVVVDPESVDKLPPYKEVVPGRTLVRVSEAVRLGMAGDRIVLEVPQTGKTFDGVVERRNRDSFGNLTYIGLLREADGRSYRFIITAGARSTFAHIATSRGTFELVASDELGWLMPTANMDQHVDYSKPDYIIREESPADED